MFTVHLNGKNTVPLYEQLYDYIKKEIQEGVLIFGDKLPSTRKLASHLQVSRNTVDMAYGQLLSEGYIESIEKKGYYVCDITTLLQIPSPEKEYQQDTISPRIFFKYDFSPFFIDINNFPFNTWRKLSNKSLQEDNNVFLQGHGQGDEDLRNAIASYLHESRSVNCIKEQIIIGAGADYLLQLLVQILQADSIIAMENPSYTQAYRIFTGLHRSVIPIDMDSSGMNIDTLSASTANIAYVTPSHQYPLGVVMPIKRRLELLKWAHASDNHYIIEDDHDSEFRYKGKPIPALQGLDNNGKVIYIGTFSRSIAPGIRVAYMVLPPTLLEVYQSKYSYYSSTVSRIDQNILANFLSAGYFERHLNKMRKIYKSKHDLLIQALQVFGESIDILGEHAGLHLVVPMKISLTEEEIITIARTHSIKLYGLKEYYISDIPKDYTPTLLFGYANLSEDSIISGINELYRILKSPNP